MQGFRFSRDEYRRSYKRLMPSQKIITSQLTVERVQDSRSCKLNVYGFPIKCPPERLGVDNFFKPMLDNLQETNPNLIAVQLDPMVYMNQAR